MAGTSPAMTNEASKHDPHSNFAGVASGPSLQPRDQQRRTLAHARGHPGKAGYSEADLEGIDFLETWPGIAPYLRGPLPDHCMSTSPGHPAICRLLHGGRFSNAFHRRNLAPGKKDFRGVRFSPPTELRLAIIPASPATSAWPGRDRLESTTCARFSGIPLDQMSVSMT